MKEECPKHSERVNVKCCGEMYRGNGRERGLSNAWRRDWEKRRSSGWEGVDVYAMVLDE